MKKIVTLSLLFSLMLLSSNSILAKNLENNSNHGKKQNTSFRNNSNSFRKQKSEDAKKNWGQIKKNTEENTEKYAEFKDMGEKEIKETIKFEKRIRKIGRKYEEAINEYYAGMEGVDSPVEKFIDDVLNGNINLEKENTIGLNIFDLWKLKWEKSKYEKSMEKLALEEVTEPTSTEEGSSAETGDTATTEGAILAE